MFLPPAFLPTAIARMEGARVPPGGPRRRLAKLLVVMEQRSPRVFGGAPLELPDTAPRGFTSAPIAVAAAVVKASPCRRWGSVRVALRFRSGRGGR